MKSVDTSLFRASHWREPKPSTEGDWCFTTSRARDAKIEFVFNGSYTDAAKAALEYFGGGVTVYVMP